MSDDVVASIRIEAPPEAVFRFFVDPDRLVRWMGTEADIEPVVGGRFSVDVTGDDVAVGAYTEIDPPRRVAFTWGWEGNDGVPPGSSTVTVDLSEVDGGTELTLTHRGLPDEDACRRHHEGWTHYLGRLATAGEGRPVPDDPMRARRGVRADAVADRDK